MVSVDKFDWSWTRRKVMVVIPYYGPRLQQTIYSLTHMKTAASDDDWGILIGDDGQSWDDLSCLEQFKNVKVVQVRKPTNVIRNGCLCRNVLIKRCESQWIINRDPEIVTLGDFVTDTINLPRCVARSYHVHTISQPSLPRVLSGELDLELIKYRVIKAPDDPSGEKPNQIDLYIGMYRAESPYKWGIHYCLACPKDDMHAIRGYDEEMANYGPDDHLIMKRLLGHGLPFQWLYNARTVHLWHDRSTVVNVTGYQHLIQNPNPIRNPAGWGDQYDRG